VVSFFTRIANAVRELLTCQEPFKEYSDQQIILGVSQGNLRPAIPPNVGQEYVELMQDWY
jgi:hypothetical protein